MELMARFVGHPRPTFEDVRCFKGLKNKGGVGRILIKGGVGGEREIKKGGVGGERPDGVSGAKPLTIARSEASQTVEVGTTSQVYYRASVSPTSTRAPLQCFAFSPTGEETARGIYESAALFHGPHYQMLQSIQTSNEGATAQIQTPRHKTLLNPFAIDAGIQAAVFWLWKRSDQAFLPMALKRFYAARLPLPCELLVQVKGAFTQKTKGICDITFFSPGRRPLACIEGLELIAYFVKQRPAKI